MLSFHRHIGSFLWFTFRFTDSLLCLLCLIAELINWLLFRLYFSVQKSILAFTPPCLADSGTISCSTSCIPKAWWWGRSDWVCLCGAPGHQTCFIFSKEDIVTTSASSLWSQLQGLHVPVWFHSQLVHATVEAKNKKLVIKGKAISLSQDWESMSESGLLLLW